MFLSNILIAKQDTDNLKEVKLSPQIRKHTLDSAIYKIRSDDIAAHFKNLVLLNSKDDFAEYPQILSREPGVLLAAVGQNIYAEDTISKDYSTFSILRGDQEYLEPETKAKLGYGVNIIGEAQVVKRNQDGIAQLVITKATKPITVGDRLTPRVAINVPNVINAKFPQYKVAGNVVGIQDGVWNSGSYNCVVLDVGLKDNLEVGHVLNLMLKNQSSSVEERGSDKESCQFTVPAMKFGEVMVFKTFDNMSLALVLKSRRLVSVADMVLAEGSSSNGAG